MSRRAFHAIHEFYSKAAPTCEDCGNELTKEPINDVFHLVLMERPVDIHINIGKGCCFGCALDAGCELAVETIKAKT